MGIFDEDKSCIQSTDEFPCNCQCRRCSDQGKSIIRENIFKRLAVLNSDFGSRSKSIFFESEIHIHKTQDGWHYRLGLVTDKVFDTSKMKISQTLELAKSRLGNVRFEEICVESFEKDGSDAKDEVEVRIRVGLPDFNCNAQAFIRDLKQIESVDLPRTTQWDFAVSPKHRMIDCYIKCSEENALKLLRKARYHLVSCRKYADRHAEVNPGDTRLLWDRDHGFAMLLGSESPETVDARCLKKNRNIFIWYKKFDWFIHRRDHHGRDFPEYIDGEVTPRWKLLHRYPKWVAKEIRRGLDRYSRPSEAQCRLITKWIEEIN